MLESFTSIFYFLRPILSIDANTRLFGVDALDIVTIGFMFIFFLVWVGKLIRGGAQPISGIDFTIIMFCAWCVSISFIYFEKSELSEVAKFILPPLSYVILKSYIRDRAHFIRCMRWMLIAFLVPTILSVALILQGNGLDKVNYWTGLARYQGVFVNPHNFGHSMTFMLMLSAIYVWFKYSTPERPLNWLTKSDKLLIALVLLFGLFALYQSYVRTAWFGLLIFVIIFAYKYNKKWVVAMLVGGLLVGFLASPILKLVFHDVVEVTEGERETERIGSGRPYIWGHNLTVFSELTFDRQLAGVGIGNRDKIFSEQQGNENIWNSHNDFLEVMMQTGVVGFLLFAWLQLLVYRRIRALPSRDMYPFLAIFLTVVFMNFASNSYVVRFSVGQMFYMLLAYIESKSVIQSSRRE